MTLAIRAYTVFMYSYIRPSKVRNLSGAQSSPPLQAVRFLDQVRGRIRYKHYSYRTEQQYVYWIRAFVRLHGARHPREMGAPEVERFLSGPAVERKAAVRPTIKRWVRAKCLRSTRRDAR